MEQQETTKSKKKPNKSMTEVLNEVTTEIEQKARLFDLINIGIPCSVVTFQTTVNAFNGEPEYTYYDGGTHRRSRNAKIYATPNYIVLVQEGGKTTLVPTANVKQATPYV